MGKSIKVPRTKLPEPTKVVNPEEASLMVVAYFE